MSAQRLKDESLDGYIERMIEVEIIDEVRYKKETNDRDIRNKEKERVKPMQDWEMSYLSWCGEYPGELLFRDILPLKERDNCRSISIKELEAIDSKLNELRDLIGDLYEKY